MQIIDESYNDPIDYKSKYNNYRITALEKIKLSTTSAKKIKEYENEIKKLIESDNLENDDKIILLQMHKKHFSN